MDTEKRMVTSEIEALDKMIFVGTCPRSGSSMICGVLERCGAFSGITNGATAANERGQYENGQMNAALFGSAFEATGAGGNIRVLRTLQDAGALPRIDYIEARITMLMRNQGYTSGAAYFKGGNFLYFFDQIIDQMPDAPWVLPVRDKKEIRRSMRRVGMAQTDEERDLLIDAYRACYDLIEAKAKEVYLIDTNKVKDGDFTQIKAAVEAMGMIWNQEEVEEWIDPELWGRGAEDFPTGFGPTSDRQERRDSRAQRRRQRGRPQSRT